MSPRTATKASSRTTTKPTTTAKKLSQEEFTAYINDPRLNRTFQLPADPSRGRTTPFQVSYADFGYHREDGHDDHGEEQVLLFFGPLMSSRLHNAAKDGLAKRYKVRIVNAERPGIGKTDSVPAERLLEVWREAIAALLNHLGIKHVSIGCHSGGTVFGLDFAVHYPQFLHPARPYIAIAGPWVHSSHSGVLIWSLASSLPRSVVAQTDKMATLVNSTLGPALGVSAAVSGSVPQLWPKAKPTGCEGPDIDLEEGIRDRVGKRVFAGSVRGLGQETQVLLRNGVEKDGWSDWGDYDVLAPRLAEAVRGVGGATLKVDVFFAEKDNMIGNAGDKGNRWFEACWRDVDGVEFTSETVKGADHDRVWDLRFGVMERVFKTMTHEA
ncbi:hypothetical protein G647_01629 [Cladophialophora carrionii CBS 160.54]|uniref:AB hydrolase-1 domain-containing protein n=1 Tax=Cladophialophora carrionii CBS 160.54 TaxID=1279043 RepID=V9DR81_9EURO|nr:uncharacterized protein G647_01629 [Cladophialophora carrionii CBS 160.54]ETI29176.1 hypothetical protein G647_01629 [Cladophialophora carrionii CBS 160.54]